MIPKSIGTVRRAHARGAGVRCGTGRARDLRVGRWLACIAAAALGGAAVQAQPAAHAREVPLAVTIGFESVRLPGDERMGLVAGSLLFEPVPDWRLGPAVFGAATGRRGGLFVGGVEVQRRFRLGRQQIVASIAAAGGGGAAAPVGGGLMLRPAVTLLHDFGPLHAGLSWSEVRFPSGDISSRQLGLVVSWDGAFRHAAPERAGETVPGDGRSGVGFDRLAATLTRYRLEGESDEPRRIGLIGARFERHARPLHASGAVWTLEAAGAASGDAAGYMEIAAGVGWETTPLPDLAPGLRAGARVALGLAGGGAVPTGGGIIGKAGLALTARISPTLSTGIEVGALRARDTALRGSVAQWWLGAALEPPDRPLGAGARLERTEWTPVLQHLLRAQRRDGRRAALDTIGLKLTQYRGDHLYLTGQAHSAYGGGAGAYAIGFVGAGLATAAPRRGWQAGIEALVGAAGGGGVDTAGGALVQGVAWAGFAVTPAQQWRIGVGAVRAPRGGLSTPLLELGWSWSFSQATP